MALTDDEQAELLAKVRYLYDQLGPTLAAWSAASSFGQYPDGTEMTQRDGLAALKREVDAISAHFTTTVSAPTATVTPAVKPSPVVPT